MTKYAIAIGLSGKIYENLIKTWKILEKEKKIKFISSRSPKPHIALTTGSAINEYKLNQDHISLLHCPFLLTM